ncbi:ribosomal protein S18 acetylase RimI-like enzyme [Solibacillus kalamii]|uniref:GNAT family N-acetyltransferase n=1 Tax=Solibacillus kalamii TaxID=1748298 RepID=A0ABX3ZKD3_9BACL|nr:GNAT family N-acetyltransferase [Solibacillus kalamii]MBM7664060.1 ribosomal protein S18 acetylase RimI-like enzyme [Solibacillus kalamii]OUZ40163.1 GNAT family N-acetyltransferase [Solibacillus kalamii]
MEIKRLENQEKVPLELLLLADPSKIIVEDYVAKGECFIAENEEQTIGVYVLLPTRPQTVEIVNVAVAENYQGKGIGKLLVSHAIRVAKTQGYKTIEIGTGNSSIGQLALYQKCGFRIVSVDHNYFIKHYSEEIYENSIQCIDMIRLSQDL